MLPSYQLAGPPVAFLLVVTDADGLGCAANCKLLLTWTPPDTRGCFAEPRDDHLWLQKLVFPGEDIAVSVM